MTGSHALFVEDNGLLIDHRARLVHVRLNRPAALNALSYSMINGLRDVLDASDGRAILLSGMGGRAFCAGGDIKEQAINIKAGNKAPVARYFHDEYGLNHAIYEHSGPYVSYLNGITMGGGYGVSAHGSHLVTTEATQFAMPEVKIGFFPDVGAAFHLARCPGETGTYLALTGNTVGPADMLYAGLAHAHVPLAKFERLQEGLQTSAPDGVLAELGEAAPGDGVLKTNRDIIDRCFAFNAVEDILDALKTDGSPFAAQTAAEIESRSPISLKVALAHLRRAAADDFAAVIARDLHLALRFIETPDFTEGVRAAIIDKDRNPRWNPGVLGAIDAATVALYLGS